MRFIRKDNILAIIFILALTFLVFWQFFLKGLYPFPGDFLLAWYEPWKTEHFLNGKILIPHKPVAEDVFRQIIPFRTLGLDIIKKIQLPLWNPYNGAGMPLLATINIGFLDPFNIIFLFLKYDLAWSIYIVIQYFLIGYFTYIYTRKISLSFASSLFSSIVFLFSGFVTVRIIFGMHGLAIALLPLILYLIESYIQNPKGKVLYLLPLCIFILIVSTQPQISFYIISFSFLYLVIKIAIERHKIKNRLIKVSIPSFLMFIGFGLSSVQLLPTLELFKLANLNKQSSSFIFESFQNSSRT